MLLEFSCSNHKSIKDKVLFSVVAGTDTTFEDKIEEITGIRVLKSAVIYGANGSGKSNFIDAISFVKNLVMNSIMYQPGQGIRQIQGDVHYCDSAVRINLKGRKMKAHIRSIL